MSLFLIKEVELIPDFLIHLDITSVIIWRYYHTCDMILAEVYIITQTCEKVLDGQVE